jgi:hypothetical protein
MISPTNLMIAFAFALNSMCISADIPSEPISGKVVPPPLPGFDRTDTSKPGQSMIPRLTVADGAVKGAQAREQHAAVADAEAPAEIAGANGYPVVKRGKHLDFARAFVGFYLNNANRGKYYYISSLENAKTYGGALGTRWLITINEAGDIDSSGVKVCAFYVTDSIGAVTRTGVQVVNLSATAPSLVSGQIVIDWDKLTPDTAYAAANWKEAGFQYQLGTIEGVKSDYELRDNIKHTVVIDAAGTGDYTDINACWAALASLSAYDNQYLIKVLPGVYNPINATPPPYSHTLGMGPLWSVIFKDASGSIRMIDQQYPSKLENIVFDVANTRSYIIHFDTPGLSYGVTVNSNCVFIHRGGGPGAAVIGGGAWPEYKSIWNYCEFVGFAGAPAIHTKENTDNAIDLEFNYCSFPQGVYLGSLGTAATSKVTFNGGSFKGNPPGFFISLLSNQPELWKYPANNINWTVRGNARGLAFNIKNIANGGEALKIEAKSYGQDVGISGSAAALLFGDNNWKTTLSNSRIYGCVTGWADVRDVQMGKMPYSKPVDIIQFWRRLGDCSVVNKTLAITVGGISQTYTFTDNYLVSRPSEASIIAAINAVITNATMSKVSGIHLSDIMQTSDKMGAKVGDGDGLVANELVCLNGYVANKVAPSTGPRDVSGIVLCSARQNEMTEIWTGPFFWTATDGEYGVGADRQLSITEPVKVGYVRSNIFYPYY